MNQVQQISNNQIMEKNLADNVQNRVLELTNKGRLNLPKIIQLAMLYHLHG